MTSICSMGIEPEGERQTKVILKKFETFPSDDFGKRAKRSPNVASFFFFNFISANAKVASNMGTIIAYCFHYCRWVPNGFSPSDACILTDFHTVLCMPPTFPLYTLFSFYLRLSGWDSLSHPFPHPLSFIILSLPSLILSWHLCSILPACLPNFFFFCWQFFSS